MGSKGRVPYRIRQPLPGPAMLHPDPYGAVRPSHGTFPFNMLPPSEILEQKLAGQHIEMERLATENQRLAATHSTLRQELAAAQQELQRLQRHMSAVKAEQEQQMSILLDKNAKWEAELQASEPLKMDLQQAHAEAQSLVAVRQELILKVQQLTQDLQWSHGDAQQIPALIAEVEALRQEYEHCRATYEYERKIFTDHYESLQVMEKNYVSMVREVEKLRAGLANTATARSSTYGTNAGYKDSDAPGYQSIGQTAHGDGYGVSLGRGSSSLGTTPYSGGPPGPAATWAAPDAFRGPSFDASRNATYDASRGTGGYDSPVVAGYDAGRVTIFEAQRGSLGHDAAKGSVVTAPGAAGVPGPIAPALEGTLFAPVGAPGHVAALYGTMLPPNPHGSVETPHPFGSVQPTAHMGGGFKLPRGGSVAVQLPAHMGGGFEVPRGGSAVRR